MNRDEEIAIEWDCQKLLRQYYHYVDQKEYEKAAELFTPDVEWSSMSVVLKGRDDIIKLPYRQHPRQQLPDEGSSEPAAVRLGSTQEKSRRVIAGSNGDRSGDTRPLWITGLSPPDSWRSQRQPGYLQLDQVRTPKHCVWGYDRTLKVTNFRSTKVGNFQSQLTQPTFPR